MKQKTTEEINERLDEEVNKMKEKHLLIGYKKDKELIKKVEKHLKKVGGVGWRLLQRNGEGKGIIRWFKRNRSYIKRIVG